MKSEKSKKGCIKCGNENLGLVRTGRNPFKYCTDCNTYMAWDLGKRKPVGYSVK